MGFNLAFEELNETKNFHELFKNKDRRVQIVCW